MNEYNGPERRSDDLRETVTETKRDVGELRSSVDELKDGVSGLSGRVGALNDALGVVNDLQARQLDLGQKAAAAIEEANRVAAQLDEVDEKVVPRAEHEAKWRQETERLRAVTRRVIRVAVSAALAALLVSVVASAVALAIVNHLNHQRLVDQRRSTWSICTRRDEAAKRAAESVGQLASLIEHSNPDVSAYLSSMAQAQLAQSRVNCGPRP